MATRTPSCTSRRPASPEPRARELAAAAQPAEINALVKQIDLALRARLACHQEDYLPPSILSPLYQDLVEFSCRPAKRLRPVLFLLAYRMFRQSALARGVRLPAVKEADLLSVAASLEFLHGFILIHDDIIDRSETRRSLPTLHRVIEHRLPAFSDRARAGKNLALVMGDILFALAQRCLLEAGGIAPDVRLRLGSLLLGCMVETGFGEAADIFYGTRDVSKVSLAEIEQMYLLKTTRYTIECPLAMAAVLAGADSEELAVLASIARPAGLAFQIQNDLQEFARFEVSDSEVPSDFLEGKKTLLLRTAFSRLGRSDRGLLQMCLGGGEPSDGRISKARELVAGSGAIGVLSRRLAALFAEADQRTNSASGPFFDARTRAGLTGLIRMVNDMAGTRGIRPDTQPPSRHPRRSLRPRPAQSCPPGTSDSRSTQSNPIP